MAFENFNSGKEQQENVSHFDAFDVSELMVREENFGE